MLKTANKFVLVLPNIRSCHNVGAIFRTADGAGVDKIYLTGYTPDPTHPKMIKVSLGAENSVPWEKHKQTAGVLKQLKAEGYKVVALEKTSKSVNMYKWRPSFPIALVVGNEVTGVTPNILKYCDEVVHLPMNGLKESLNVSIASGIAIYFIANS
jgi:tRNA G18 (ribose-2'-O)-methylase SpoU